jgi:hypothetical protein
MIFHFISPYFYLFVLLAYCDALFTRLLRAVSISLAYTASGNSAWIVTVYIKELSLELNDCILFADNYAKLA